MAKTVKFNLRFGDTPIRTIEDLRENFSIDDVFEYYSSGLLLRFLQLRGYDEYAAKVAELPSSDNIDDILVGLVKIFIADTDSSALSEHVDTLSECAEIIKLENERVAFWDKVRNDRLEGQLMVIEYINVYFNIIKELIANKEDISHIRALTGELLNEYAPILRLDYRRLFNDLVDNEAYYPVYHMLSSEFFREKWINAEGQTLEVSSDLYVIQERINNITASICYPANNLTWLKKTNKIGDGTYWEDIEDSGRNYMILQVQPSADLRLPQTRQEFPGRTLSNNYPLFNGIQYRHKSSSVFLYYVEV